MVIVIAVSLWLILLGVAFLSRKEQGKLPMRMSLWLYKSLRNTDVLAGYMKTQEGRVRQILISLHPGMDPEMLLKAYYAGKIRIVLVLLVAGSMLACGAEVAHTSGIVEVSGGVVRRGTETETVELEYMVKTPKEEGIKGHFIERGTIALDIDERKWSPEEAEALYPRFTEDLETLVVGANESLEEVRQDLYLPDQVEGYPFWMEWSSDNRAILGSDGRVHAEDLQEGVAVTLTAHVTYGDLEWKYCIDTCVYPPVRTESEQMQYDLKKQSMQTEWEGRYEEQFVLPEMIAGKSIMWNKKDDNTGGLILFLACISAALVYQMKDRDLWDDLLERKVRIRQEYPILVNKFALFLGSGMTIRSTFLKICHDYYDDNRKKGNVHPLYEEMLYSCNELRAGVSESKVYDNFGRRTGVQEFTRFCTLLDQNLKKGNSMLIQRLKEEGEEAIRQSIQFRKRKGEEAGTKLLLPMIMMLLLVLLMIMLPAFSGLGI